MNYKTSILLNCLLRAVAVAAAAWIGITSMAWQFNNPKANPSTYWTHFSDAIRFKSLPEFQ